jgi:predicted nuclease of predicted toxin-antitoxin system
MKPYESEDTTSRLPEPTFFLDRTIDNPTVLNGLRDIGCSVIPHHALFKHNEDDNVWIEEVSKKGYIIITNDKKISSRALEIKSVIIHKARMLCLTNGNMSSSTQLEVLKSGMGLIKKHIKEAVPPYIVRVRRGDGKIQKVSLNPLKLPIDQY